MNARVIGFYLFAAQAFYAAMAISGSEPRSCEESLAFGNNYTGLHTLQSLDGSSYKAFCQFDHLTHTGLTFISKYAVQNNPLDIDLIFTNRNHAVVRFLNDDDTQSETVVSQLPEYNDTLLTVQQNTASDYAPPVANSLYGDAFLYLGFLRYEQANRTGMKQGLASSGIELAYNNCDANPNSYFAFYSDVNTGPDPPPLDYFDMEPEYLQTRVPTKQEHYIHPKRLFNYTGVVHFGGCGILACSRNWNATGIALGLPFKSVPCSTSPPCVLFSTRNYQSAYYPGDKVIYSCTKGYVNTSSHEVRCGIQGQWIDPWPTCTRQTSVIREDKYKKLEDAFSWSCPWNISDVVPAMTSLKCAKLCTESSQCMMYAMEDDMCIITNGIIDTLWSFNKYIHWFIKE